MYAAQTFDGLSALLWNELLAAYEQTGTISGVGVSLTTSSTAIDFDVASGDVQIDGTPTSVATQTATLDANGTDWPRRDVIWVDANGTAQVRKGDPEPYEPARDADGDFVNDRPARETYRPAPDDMDDILRADPSIGTVQATVVVPPHTDSADELTDDDWTDRRITVPSTAGAGSHDNLTDVSSADHHTRYSDDEARTAAAVEHDTLRTMAIPDASIDADTEATAGHVRVPSGSTAEVTETQVHDATGAAQTTLQIAIVDSAGTDVYTSTARRDASPNVSVAGQETLSVEVRNTNASGGNAASGGGHAIIKFV